MACAHGTRIQFNFIDYLFKYLYTHIGDPQPVYKFPGGTLQ